LSDSENRNSEMLRKMNIMQALLNQTAQFVPPGTAQVADMYFELGELRIAADLGSPRAILRRAQDFADTGSIDEARVWFAKAANTGDIECIFHATKFEWRLIADTYKTKLEFMGKIMPMKERFELCLADPRLPKPCELQILTSLAFYHDYIMQEYHIAYDYYQSYLKKCERPERKHHFRFVQLEFKKGDYKKAQVQLDKLLHTIESTPDRVFYRALEMRARLTLSENGLDFKAIQDITRAAVEGKVTTAVDYLHEVKVANEASFRRWVKGNFVSIQSEEVRPSPALPPPEVVGSPKLHVAQEPEVTGSPKSPVGLPQDTPVETVSPNSL